MQPPSTGADYFNARPWQWLCVRRPHTPKTSVNYSSIPHTLFPPPIQSQTHDAMHTTTTRSPCQNPPVNALPLPTPLGPTVPSFPPASLSCT